MNEEKLRLLLRQVADGTESPDVALEALRLLPFVQEADVLADTHRAIRQGFPEAVLAGEKSLEQTRTALRLLSEAQGYALATRVGAEMGRSLTESFPAGVYVPDARLFHIGSMPPLVNQAPVAVVSAGTSDRPVAEEAAGTLEFAGAVVHRFQDVGVAGLHRLLSRLDQIRSCRVIIAVAGMEGALPGVLAGLVAQPLIAVPTSVGYGASFGGISALLTMLNSCANGAGVVNIDNGFGAALLALRILNTDKSLL